MKLWILIVATLFVVVTGDRYGLLHYSRSEKALAKCLEDHESGNIVFNELKKRIADSFARKLSIKTLTSEDVNMEIRRSIVYSDGSIAFGNNQTLRIQFEKAMKKALRECSDDFYVNSVSSSSTSTSTDSYQVLPHFVDEPGELGLLLDYVLVNWPYLREHMISSQNRRSILRKYAEKALSIFKNAYYDDRMYFINDELRSLWLRRALLLFDGYDTLYPYINHIFNENNTFPHTSGDTNMFIGRNVQNIRFRDPAQPRSDVDRILYIHVSEPQIA